MNDSVDSEPDPDDTRLISAVPKPAIPEQSSDDPTVIRPNRAASGTAPVIASVPEFGSMPDEIVLGPPLEMSPMGAETEDVGPSRDTSGPADADLFEITSDTRTISRPSAPAVRGHTRASDLPRRRRQSLVVRAAVIAVAILAAIAGYLATRAVRGHAATSGYPVVTRPVPTVASVPPTTGPTEAEIAKEAIAGPRSFALEMVSCMGLDQCPHRRTQSATVVCSATGCAIVNGPGAVWEGKSIPLVQHDDPRRFTATANMKPGKGFRCNGRNVATAALLDLRLSTPNLLLSVGKRLPIVGKMTVRTTASEPSCGAVAPRIVWSLREPA